jgi:cytoskeletal protein CcmA (bactofilin family)
VIVLKQIINQDPASAPRVERPGFPASEPLSPVQPVKSTPTYSHSSAMSASKNILSNDVEIIGNLKFSHDLIIDGKIEGEVNSDGNLTVGENARVKGEIKTKSVVVFGKVEGNITVTERCELKANAELHGDISAGTLAIEEGAQFMGASRVGAAARAMASEPKPPLPTTPPRPAPIVNP